jgi:hypothetical protein
MCGYSIRFGIDISFIISLVNNTVLVFRVMNNELYAPIMDSIRMMTGFPYFFKDGRKSLDRNV